MAYQGMTNRQQTLPGNIRGQRAGNNMFSANEMSKVEF